MIKDTVVLVNPKVSDSNPKQKRKISLELTEILVKA